ncbi:MAG: serine/threonine protein phosphatase [Rhodomicrobium sp.]|nr:serine/threonine protein phosphatase [Rhodomicrobium sp.]
MIVPALSRLRDAAFASWETSIVEAAVPDGIRVYAVGDIHGRLDLLDELLSMIAANERSWPAERAFLIFLGDYIDRGPDSAGVIDRLLSGLPDDLQPVFLRGNHEDMMQRCLGEPGLIGDWMTYGGMETLQSYGIDLKALRYGEIDAADLSKQLQEKIPLSHRAFLNSLQVTAELGDYFFVHAGVRPGIALDAQSLEDCLYIRGRFLDYPGDFGKIVVHGHTPADEPEVRSNRIGIDTGAFFTGRLTAVCLEGASRIFLGTRGAAEGVSRSDGPGGREGDRGAFWLARRHRQ